MIDDLLNAPLGFRGLASIRRLGTFEPTRMWNAHRETRESVITLL